VKISCCNYLSNLRIHIVFAFILQAYFFDEYQMDGVNKEHNEIFLEITLENLCRALKSAQNAKSLKIKLTKKQTACLTVEIELVSVNLKYCRYTLKLLFNISVFSVQHK